MYRGMSILWTIIICFFVGGIAKFIMPGDKYEPKGFILTTILGIVGAFVAIDSSPAPRMCRSCRMFHSISNFDGPCRP
jgi:hypothetical protein